MENFQLLWVTFFYEQQLPTSKEKPDIFPVLLGALGQNRVV